MYELKTYSGVMCHENEEWYKHWSGNDLSFWNWGTSQILTQSLKKSKKFVFKLAPWDQSTYCLSYKSTEELPFIKLNKDTKFGVESTCGFKLA